MEEQKPKSVKSIGLLITILSALIIIGNTFGILAWTIIGFGKNINGEAVGITRPLSFLLTHYAKFCLTMIAMGGVSLIGGIFVRRYKLWANRMISLISVLLILIIWALMIVFYVKISKQAVSDFLLYGLFINALVWSIPFFLLIRYLNRNKIIRHFS